MTTATSIEFGDLVRAYGETFGVEYAGAVRHLANLLWKPSCTTSAAATSSRAKIRTPKPREPNP